MKKRPSLLSSLARDYFMGAQRRHFQGLIQAVIDRLHRKKSPSNETLDRELGQAMLRVTVSAVVTIYLAVTLLPQELPFGVPFWFVFAASYVVFAAGLVWRVRSSSTSPAIRRYLGNLADTCAISYVMIGAQESAMPLFALYLWVTFGNGFRYGLSALMVSSVLSVAGFAVVVAVTPAWQAHALLAVGVFVSLVVLPLYTAHLLRMLNAALRKAHEASAVKSQFLARMSHELRTPLNGIRGSVELLRGSRRLLPDERTLLDVIDDSVAVSLRQIDNVLDFSKLEAGKLVLEETKFDLHALLNSTVAMVRPAVAQKRVRLMVRISPTMPFALIGDGHHLRAILLNLLSNAAKFTERGFVCVEASTVDEAPERVRIRFEIVDTGIGISPAGLTRVFESFSQEDVSTTRRYGGTGLGTAIAKQLVELMGGDIGVQSIKGRGTLFWFEIPFRRQVESNEITSLDDAKAILLATDAQLLSHFKKLLPQQLLSADSEQMGAEMIARGLRIGNPVQVLMIEHALAVGTSADHMLSGLVERALIANTPSVLVSDNPPPVDRLREWGYAATLRRTPTMAEVATVLHASPHTAVDEDAKVVSIAPWTWDEKSSNKPKILVADDNQTNLMITTRMLERGGYEVETVESGDEAAERLASGKYRLAVLDMHMPDVDGPDVVRRYRALRPRSSLPIVVLTANASIAAQQACAEAGADAYLSKPVTLNKLLGEVKRLLDGSTIEKLPVARKIERETHGEANEEIIDISVLAELDRIYRDPSEFQALVQGYEREGQELLRRLAAASKARNHPAFCDVAHALKSNGANVGAHQLMEACQVAGAASIFEFVRERDRFLHDIERAFSNSVVALRDMSATVPRNRSSE